MAIFTIIAGKSGSGKSASMETINWDETFVIRPNRKPFPFSSKGIKAWDKETKTGNFLYTDDYPMIQAVLAKLPEYGKKIVIIEDSTHILLKETMDTALEKGYDKFMHAALNFYNMIKTASELPDNVRVYMISHVDSDANGEEIIKITGGKFITEKIDVPSLATIALGAVKTKEGHMFRTQSSGRDFYKSPKGLFDSEFIPNDLGAIDKAIVEYYGIGE